MAAVHRHLPKCLPWALHRKVPSSEMRAWNFRTNWGPRPLRIRLSNTVRCYCKLQMFSPDNPEENFSDDPHLRRVPRYIKITLTWPLPSPGITFQNIVTFWHAPNAQMTFTPNSPDFINSVRHGSDRRVRTKQLSLPFSLALTQTTILFSCIQQHRPAWTNTKFLPPVLYRHAMGGFKRAQTINELNCRDVNICTERANTWSTLTNNKESSNNYDVCKILVRQDWESCHDACSSVVLLCWTVWLPVVT